MAGINDAFVRLDETSDDLSLTVNGIHIIRVHKSRIGGLTKELAPSEAIERLKLAGKEYSEDKVSKLLGYELGADYRLPAPIKIGEEEDPPTGYYLFNQVMSLDRQGVTVDFRERVDSLDDREFSKLKYKITRNLCERFGVKYPGEVENGLQSGVNYRSISTQIRDTTSPLEEYFGKANLDSATRELIADYIARRYTPQSGESIKKSVQKIALMFSEMFSAARRYGFLMPKEEQLLVFFTQVAERVFGEKDDPLIMLMVTCPRYNEENELSETASAYLSVLPHLASVFTKYEIPYRGYILVDDAEERVAGGLYLSRLGLARESYRAECIRNVEVVRQTVASNNRLAQVLARPFGDMFPDFMNVVADLERRLYQLTLDDSELRLSMAKIADARLPRHTRILGGQCDFSDSLYLTIHYSAEYMALGYLCRLYPELRGDSFIINYNSPNIGQFNDLNLLARCIKEDISPDNLSTVPVFQVKLY